LSHAFPVQDGLQQDAVSPVFLNFALEYSIRNAQENGGKGKFIPVL
jgi:hypothetical protein